MNHQEVWGRICISSQLPGDACFEEQGLDALCVCACDVMGLCGYSVVPFLLFYPVLHTWAAKTSHLLLPQDPRPLTGPLP